MMWGSMKARFSVLMLCGGKIVASNDPIDWTLVAIAPLLARRDGFLAQRSGWEMRIDDTRPKDAVS